VSARVETEIPEGRNSRRIKHIRLFISAIQTYRSTISIGRDFQVPGNLSRIDVMSGGHSLSVRLARPSRPAIPVYALAAPP
jgi:hypothetical protein